MTNRIAVVTGGNKGLGFEICRQLAVQGIHVVLTARDETRGLRAVKTLQARAGWIDPDREPFPWMAATGSTHP